MSPFIINLLLIVAYAFLIAILVRVVFSWIGPSYSNPLYRMSYQLTEPILAPIRNVLPGGSMGMDFSPMVVTVVLLLLISFLKGL